MLNMDLARLQNTLNEYVEKTNAAPAKAAKSMMLTINRETILQTPVDTGRLVGGWMISTGTPSSKTPPERKTKADETAARSSKIQDNTNKIEAFKSGILWLTNNVRYARIVEFGAGRRVGKFMLSKAVQIAIQKVRNKIA